MAQRPVIGVIAESPLQRHILQKVLTAYGLSVDVNCGPEVFEHQPEERLGTVDCWLVDIETESLEAPVLETLFEISDKPVLFGLEKAPEKHDELYISWERRLFAKLEEHLGQLEVLETEESILALDAADDSAPIRKDSIRASEPAKEIWILAASLGGPAAVKEFLDHLPADIDIGFLYAQHVDPHFSKVLTKVLSRHSELDLMPLKVGRHISAGEVMMVPVDKEVSFGALGCQIHDRPWPGPYGPSIDQLFANALEYFGHRCHAIVFSGMGNDGALT
ncbi:MAG: chemotaxis protein CheB, partial [Oleiphilaceae bacterium]|nr:chemotaxis protein CheB [Oleiphilaceae bacterium]